MALEETLARLGIQITFDSSGLRDGITKVNTKWKQLGNTLSNVGQTMKSIGNEMQTVGNTLSKYVTAPIVAMGTLSAKSAIEFESAFAGVKKTVDATEKQFAELETGIRDMAKELPASTTEISHVAEAARTTWNQNRRYTIIY